MIFYSPELDEICFAYGMEYDGERPSLTVGFVHGVTSIERMFEYDWHFVGFL